MKHIHNYGTRLSTNPIQYFLIYNFSLILDSTKKTTDFSKLYKKFIKLEHLT